MIRRITNGGVIDPIVKMQNINGTSAHVCHLARLTYGVLLACSDHVGCVLRSRWTLRTFGGLRQDTPLGRYHNHHSHTFLRDASVSRVPAMGTMQSRA